jgi:hypothetical protein
MKKIIIISLVLISILFVSCSGYNIKYLSDSASKDYIVIKIRAMNNTSIDEDTHFIEKNYPNHIYFMVDAYNYYVLIPKK